MLSSIIWVLFERIAVFKEQLSMTVSVSEYL